MPDMTNEIDNHRPTPSEAGHLLVSRSLLAQTVETQLLPEEKFDSISGEIKEIQKIDEDVGVLTLINDHYEAFVLRSNGHSLTYHLDPSSHDLANKADKTYLSVLRDNEHTNRFNDLLGKLGYVNPDLIIMINNKWKDQVSKYLSGSLNSSWSNMVTKERVLTTKEFFIPLGQWKMEVGEDGTGEKYFVCHTDKANFLINPKDNMTKISISSDDFNKLKNPSATLGGNLTLEAGEHLFKINDKNGREVVCFSGSKPKLDPSDSSKIYFINTGRIYSLDLRGIENRSTQPILESQIRIEDPLEIDFDPNVNFFIVRSKNKLSIIDRESGEVAKEFDNVLGPMMIDKQGDILFVDTNKRLREIQTNFQAIPTGGSETARARREEELKQLQERFASLELKKVQRQRGGEITEEDVANTLREAIAKQVDESLAQATDPNAIEEIMDRLQGFKAEETSQGYGEVVDEFISKAREKLSGIRTVEFDRQLGEYEKSLQEVQSVGDTIGLDEEFAKLLELRQKTDITDPVTRRGIEQRIRNIQSRKDSVVGQYQNELKDTIQQAFPNIEQLIKETGSSQELAMFNTTVEAQQFEMMLANVRDPQVRKELRDRLNTVKTEQRTQLEARGRQLEEEQRLRWAQVVEEAKEDLDSLRQQIAELSDSREVDRFDRNPLVTAWRAKIYALPPELREIEEKKLEVVLGSRKKDIEHRKELGAVGEQDDLKFGNASFTVYKEPPRIWQPVFLPIKGALPDYADLVFQDGQGRTWRPDPDHQTVVIADMNDEKTARMVERYGKEAERFFKGIKREVPEYSDRWRISDYQMKKLEELAESINIQVDNHMGITILEGEAGTGKSALVDILGNLSNREVITIACNEQTVKEDLSYEFVYDPQKGSYKLPARLVTGIKKPGVIILFEEINTIKPGIVKMLNPLFDYKRRLIANEGGVQNETHVDPTVILIGTMNPQDYSDVSPLAETILSRADIIEVDYPPFEEMAGGRTLYRSDEGEMLYSYVHVLETLKQREFKMAWDYVINKDTTNGADRILQSNPPLEKDIRRLYDAIRLGNRLRDMYQAYQIGESNEPMDFTTSLREMVNIALRMNHAQNVKEVARRVILPKIGDRRQRVMVDQTINAVLP